MPSRVRNVLSLIQQKSQSFVVTLPFSDLRPHIDILPDISLGSDAVEFRADLLREPESTSPIPTPDYVGSQLSLLRSAVPLPVVFAIRTQPNSGSFHPDAVQEALELYTLAIKMGCEFIDVEVTSFPDELPNKVHNLAQNSTSKIIATQYDPQNEISLSKSDSWIPVYKKCIKFGDIVRLVGTAHQIEDNFALHELKKWAASEYPEIPLIAINGGRAGQLSLILNNFMTPVTHPAHPSQAIPGQLSASEIRQASTLLGAIEPKKFYLFGTPIQLSKSPLLHNSLHKEMGLPHEYLLCETDDMKEVKKRIRSPDFGGASVTMPVKIDVIPLLDDVDEDARIIGAVNTIVPVRKPGSNEVRLIGRNTDFLGIRDSLFRAGASAAAGSDTKSGLVIGGGGTARAAIHALRSLNYSPIYLLGRNKVKIQDLAKSFQKSDDLIVVDASLGPDAAMMTFRSLPKVAVGTVPAHIPMDPSLAAALRAFFQKSHQSENTNMSQDEGGSCNTPNILIEMAYTPVRTALMKMAEEIGAWKTVKGLETVVTQAVWQYEYWTGIRVRGLGTEKYIKKICSAALLPEVK